LGNYRLPERGHHGKNSSFLEKRIWGMEMFHARDESIL